LILITKLFNGVNNQRACREVAYTAHNAEGARNEFFLYFAACVKIWFLCSSRIASMCSRHLSLERKSWIRVYSLRCLGSIFLSFAGSSLLFCLYAN